MRLEGLDDMIKSVEDVPTMVMIERPIKLPATALISKVIHDPWHIGSVGAESQLNIGAIILGHATTPEG